ncbi:DUF5659 domain-containing protein [Clostridium botulinum]|uniref:DUF5659 domain-containing protein n=1 Tax=Clostridium botulinum TaxID=1491 RepID=UPI0007E25E2E|nr:DUF5659 domain-containing protein [Clostridium botulinum]KEI92169.1 hypothetical protein N491_09920 [Clostridium botulinum B2 275]NFD55362.1 hypothetical protein [Clostridium botulinum]HDK7179294.1 hypothetical protein [Clostridium botulinum]HDK7223621.1 hypothetical protein [Clostridium botulinum]HDK7271047.1 hypothetical protein [Clostridium botulinum]
MEEIKIVNRAKIAYLYMNDIFEDRIEEIERNGQEMWAFVFENNDRVHELLKEYDGKTDLKKYNSAFKFIAMQIKKKKMEE